MDEMKGAYEIETAMREVVQHRDNALSKALVLSSARRTTLSNFLARQFPVETRLCELALTRDNALDQSAPKIPAPVESVLRRQVAAGEPTRDVGSAAVWLGRLRSPLAVVLTACALITAALVALGRWEASRRTVSNVPAVPPLDSISVESGMEPFTRMAAIGPFNLSTNEPASLQASFLPRRRIRFVDGNDTSLGLRLDLPVRAALMEDGLARTP